MFSSFKKVEVERARERYETFANHFQEVLSDTASGCPYGCPYPNGPQNIRWHEDYLARLKSEYESTLSAELNEQIERKRAKETARKKEECKRLQERLNEIGQEKRIITTRLIQARSKREEAVAEREKVSRECSKARLDTEAARKVTAQKAAEYDLLQSDTQDLMGGAMPRNDPELQSQYDEVTEQFHWIGGSIQRSLGADLERLRKLESRDVTESSAEAAARSVFGSSRSRALQLGGEALLHPERESSVASRVLEVGGEIAMHAVVHPIGEAVGERIVGGIASFFGAASEIAARAGGLAGGFVASISHVGTLNPEPEFSPEQLRRTDEYLKRTYGTDAAGNPNRPWRKTKEERAAEASSSDSSSTFFKKEEKGQVTEGLSKEAESTEMQQKSTSSS